MNNKSELRILQVNTEAAKLGRFGEKAAAKYLKKKGYKILERNYVVLSHEIDIIAKKDDIIAFVEVKTRSADKLDPREPRPASAVSQQKQRSIIGAAKYYSQFIEGMKRRLDIVEVLVSSDGKHRRIEKIVHMEGAFNVNTAYAPRYSNKR